MRTLDTKTLDAAAVYYAGQLLQPDRPHPRLAGRFVGGPSFVVQTFYDLTFKDEFAYLCGAIRPLVGAKALADFDKRAKKAFAPRDDKVLEALLAAKLAITPSGEHIEGKIGSTEVGRRLIGHHSVEVESLDSIRWRKANGLPRALRRETESRRVPLYWPIYAGEGEERAAGNPHGAADPLPPGTPGLPVGALNTRISNEAAIAACDAIVDRLDEGTGAAVIQGRSGAQPADPDTVVTGTLLFTLVCSDPAFGNAADANPGGRATASAITDDSSADATGTLGYCRASATNDGATPLDDHIDGEAGTSGADFNFNTVSIVAGSTVSMSSWTFTQPES